MLKYLLINYYNYYFVNRALSTVEEMVLAVASPLSTARSVVGSKPAWDNNFV